MDQFERRSRFAPTPTNFAPKAVVDGAIPDHVYASQGIQRCVAGGVRSIEHGQLTDADAAMMMADASVVWSLQPFLPGLTRDSIAFLPTLAKWQAFWEGTDRAYKLAIELGFRTAFGIDILFDPLAAADQGRMLAALQIWVNAGAGPQAGDLRKLRGSENGGTSRFLSGSAWEGRSR